MNSNNDTAKISDQVAVNFQMYETHGVNAIQEKLFSFFVII